MTALLIIAGLILLAVGGELIVRGAVGIANRIGISPMLAGLTIVGFGTSTPELATSLQAAFAGAPGIALGNVIGSNIANILLILGISALIYPLTVNRLAYRRDAIALMGSALLCAAAVALGTVGPASGIVLLVALVGYIYWAYRSEAAASAAGPDAEAERHIHEAEDTTPPAATNGWLLAGMVIIGLAGAIFGARLLVQGAVILAQAAGMSESVIGLTIVAVGTSLPELVACVVAVLRRHMDVAIGNVIGSNIYNICGILGITAIIHPIEVAAEIARFDIWIMLGVTALLLVQLRSGWKVTRIEGAVLVALYAGYTAFLFMR